MGLEIFLAHSVYAGKYDIISAVLTETITDTG